MRKKEVVVNDKMQKNYRYWLIEPAGKNFTDDFKPELSPKEMLRLGIFGGKYMTDCRKEFPEDWFEKAKLDPQKHNPKLKKIYNVLSELFFSIPLYTT